ncbi:hypothetical protein IFM89_001133 [Coptis chinensis]|uniref:Homeobox-DDT domain protein RLT3 n=1 Tax=Coptis chinensis TaxID=261450 RepID=A0A835IGA9_9MAGN|nr:hypothetical protein IFM89_001133 [Coptis chinensis]
MGNDDLVTTFHATSSKRRTPHQLEALEDWYSDDRYPSKKAMDDFASSLNLTYKQVRGWFVERRRKDKRETTLLSFHQYHSTDLQRPLFQTSLKPKPDLLSLDFILKKVFRKDGPPLGVQFDPLPHRPFSFAATSCGPTCSQNQRKTKKRKVSNSLISVYKAKAKKSVSLMKHGMGKGLMTVWRATNPGVGDCPTGVNYSDRDIVEARLHSTSTKLIKPLRRERRKSLHHNLAAKLGRKKLLERRKRANRNAKVSSHKAESTKKPYRAECKLALERLRFQEHPNAITELVDDEELELRELQTGPNPLTCSAHLASNGMHGCSLCKDLLASFPPPSVKMKQPLCVQPWGSSEELVKKLFKIFRFICSHSCNVDICPFTLDEFAQAFHDKDSLLLGKIHVVLLKLLFSDIEMELGGGSLPHANKDYRFVGFLHAVREQEVVLKFWNRSLNPLTWTEILRQVLIAAGFNSKPNKFRREPFNKDDNHLAEYGLRPGTLKAVLFSILSEQGNNGSKVSELAKAVRVVELHLTNTTAELEILIYSTLSSDITLFEKISPSGYRLRSNPLTIKSAGVYQSDSEDSGSVDGDSGNSNTISSDESELDSGRTNLSIVKPKQHHTKKSHVMIECTEIDESNSGELWVLALMEGEYSDLSIEEKLDSLVALVDLTSAGSSIRVKNPVCVATESLPTIQHHGGAKLKRSSANQNSLSNPFTGNISNAHGMKEIQTPRQVVLDSSEPLNCRMNRNDCTKKNDFLRPEGSEAIEEVGLDGHPLQSIYLGSDRRFNSYWIFLGPCNANDPGHRRIYFESSEDGHWEMLNTREALCALVSVLDGRGSREACLLATLMRLEAFLCEAMSTGIANHNDMRQPAQSDESCIDIIGADGSSPISDVDNNLILTEIVHDSLPSSGAVVLGLGKVEEQKRKWDHLQAFGAWVWSSFYSNLNAVKHGKRSYLDSLVHCTSCHDLYWRDEKHCKICHTTFELDFDLEERYAIHVATCRQKAESSMFPKHKVLSSQLQSLKAALHAIEGVMPKEALVSSWTTSDHKLWVTRLRRTSSLSELLQVLTDFVGAINEDWLCRCNTGFGCDTTVDEIIQFFPTIPQTSSAVALWLVKLDDSVAPFLKRSHSEQTQGRNTRQKRNLAYG